MNVLEKILEELETLHNKILKDKFAEQVTEQEIDSLIKAKDIIYSQMSEKEKVSSAEIISQNIDGKPYYGIKYKKVGEHHYTVGYGSYKLDYVINWLNECFEFCGDVKVSVNVAKDTNVPSNDGWIPVEESLPENDGYTLVSFENFSVPMVGRYEVDDEGGGKFYIGDEDESCISQDLFVNAWQPLPGPYKGA